MSEAAERPVSQKFLIASRPEMLLAMSPGSGQAFLLFCLAPAQGDSRRCGR
jgi:hypothetical protein